MSYNQQQNSIENGFTTDSTLDNQDYNQSNYQHSNGHIDQDFTSKTSEIATTKDQTIHQNFESEIPEQALQTNGKQEDQKLQSKSQFTCEGVASSLHDSKHSNKTKHSFSQEGLGSDVDESEQQNQDDSRNAPEHCDGVLSINANSTQETEEPENDSIASTAKLVAGKLKLVNLDKMGSQKIPTPSITIPIVWFPVKEEPLDSCDAPAEDTSEQISTPEHSHNEAVGSQIVSSASSIGSLQTLVDQLHTNVKLEPVTAPDHTETSEESRTFNYGCQIKVERADSQTVDTKKCKVSSGREQHSFESFSLESVKMLPLDELYSGDTGDFNCSDVDLIRDDAQPGIFIDPEEKSEIKNATIRYATGRSLKYFDKYIPHGWSRLKTQRKNGRVEIFDVYYLLNTPCGGHLKFRSKREIQEYLDNIGETMITGESFEFLATKVPILPTPALQAFDTKERQASVQLYIQHFLTNPPILNLGSNFPFASGTAIAKESDLMPNCIFIAENGRSQCHDLNVPRGWVKTIQKSENMSVVSFATAKDNLIFNNKLDIQSYLEAVSEPFLTSECFDFSPTLSLPPAKKKKKKSKTNNLIMPGATLVTSQKSVEAGNLSDKFSSPTHDLLPPPTYLPVSGLDPLLKGLLNPSKHIKSKKENGNFENGTSPEPNDSGNKSSGLVYVDSLNSTTILSAKGGLSKEALLKDINNKNSNRKTSLMDSFSTPKTALHLKPTTLLVKSKLGSNTTPQSNISQNQPSTITNNGATLKTQESSFVKEPILSADFQLGHQKGHGTKHREGQASKKKSSVKNDTSEDKLTLNFAPQISAPIIGHSFPFQLKIENQDMISESNPNNSYHHSTSVIETHTSAVKGRPRYSSEIEPCLSKYRRISVTNKKRQVVQIDDDDDIMEVEVPKSAPPRKPDFRDRISIAEFLSDSSNYSPGLKIFFSGNVMVQIYGGLDYIIHDETVPMGWQKCCKGVPNQPGIFITWFVSPDGSNINSQLKLEKYLSTNFEPGLSRRDFDFKPTPTFPRSAKILARQKNLMTGPPKLPLTLDLVGAPPSSSYSKHNISAESVPQNTSNFLSSKQLPISASLFTQRYEETAGTSHVRGTPPPALSGPNNLNAAIILSKYLSAQQNNIGLQNNYYHGQMQSNSDPEVINLDDDDDDDNDESNLLSQIQSEISLKGNKVPNSFYSLKPCTFCGQVFANDFLLSNHVYAYHQNFF